MSALGKLIGRLASNGYPFWLAWVLKLTMTPSLGYLKPAIILNRFQNLGHFHLIR